MACSPRVRKGIGDCTYQHSHIPSQTITLRISSSSRRRTRSRPSSRRRHDIFRKAGVVVPDTASDAGELGGTRNLREGVRRVVGIPKPVEPPVAAGLELGRQGRALGPVRDAAVLGAPGAAELGRAPVEYAGAAARDLQVELVPAQVPACVDGLDQHHFAFGLAGCEGQGIAGTAPAGFRATANGSGCKTIGDKAVGCPRGLVGARESSPTALTARDCLVIREWVIIDIASIRRVRNIGLARPSTRGLATVPVSAIVIRFARWKELDKREEGRHRKKKGGDLLTGIFTL